MINLLKTLCKKSDVDNIWVGTGNDNLAAKRLYESTGVCAEEDKCEFIYSLSKPA